MKVLITRFSSIGDIVLTTPVIRCLKNQVENVEIHFLTRSLYTELLANNPYLHKIHAFQSNLKEIIKDLKEEKFDYVIDLQKNLRSLKLKTLLRKPVLSFNKLNLRKFMLVHFKIGSIPDLHIVDRYLDSLRTLGVRNDGKGLDHFIPRKEEVDISQFPQEFQSGFLTWVIGAGHYTKTFPEHKVIEILSKVNRPVVLLGGQEDRERGSRIAGEFYYVLNKCGDYTLNQASSVIRQSQKVISNDTGLMHIAAALEKPVISIWGNTIPEFGMKPYYGAANKEEDLSSIMQVENLYCRPCSKIGFMKCPEGHFRCMREIDNDEVIAAIQSNESSD